MSRTRLTPKNNLDDRVLTVDDDVVLEQIANDRNNVAKSKMAALLGGTAFFGYFITQRSMAQFLGSVAGKVILPFIAVSSLANIFYRWKDYQHTRQIENASSGLTTFVVNAVANTGIAVATLLALATTTVVAPILAVSALAIKSLFDLGMAAKDAIQAYRMPVTDESLNPLSTSRKNELYRNAGKHLLNGALSLTFTVAMGLMFSAGYAALTILAAASTAASFASVNGFREGDSTVSAVSLTNPQDVSAYEQQNVNDSSSTARIMLKAGHGLPNAVNVVSTQHYAKAAKEQADFVSQRKVANAMFNENQPLTQPPAEKDYSIKYGRRP